MNHVVDPLTGKVVWHHVGSMEDGPDREAATALVARRDREARVRDGLVPDVPRRDYGRLLCGCPSEHRITDDAGVEVCTKCTEERWRSR